jgi:hypothetical protein
MQFLYYRRRSLIARWKNFAATRTNIMGKIMDRRRFLHGSCLTALGLLVPASANADVLRAGNFVSLKCLGAANGPRFLDGRTGDGTVGLAPAVLGHFTGTRWQVWAGGGQILLKCMGAVEGPRWLDGRTGNGGVGLAPDNKNQFTGTHWRVHPMDGANPDIVALECLGTAPGPRWLDGRTGDGTVGLAASTNPPFTGTRWEAAFYPVQIDPGSEGHPASN